MEIAVSIVGVCFVLLMLVLVGWVAGLDERVRRLEQPRAPLPLTPADFADDLRVLPPARRRSSGAE